MTIDTVIGSFAPHVCLGCGREGCVLCKQCQLLLDEPPEPYCVGCHKLSPMSRVCTTCRSWLPLLSGYISARYEGVYESLVKELKFMLHRDAAQTMAGLMARALPETVDSTWLLCPVPTAPKRIRERGFDHIAEIMKHLSRILPHEEAACLVRTSNVRQLGATRHQRIQQMQHEFSIAKNAEVKGKKVLLVDDVVTTGASIAAASRTLRDAGAIRVSALVFAQKT